MALLYMQTNRADLTSMTFNCRVPDIDRQALWGRSLKDVQCNINH